MSKSIVIVLSSLTVCFVQAQIPGFGGCPKFKVEENFDAQRYLGLWYEVEKYPFIFTLGGRCVTAEYGLRDDGKVSVFNKQIRNGREDKILGSARLSKPGFGILGVSFPNIPFEMEANYNILETDYENYAVVLSCNSFFGLLNAQVVWILARSRNPSQGILDRTHEVLRTNRVSTTFLSKTDNDNCPDEYTNDNFRH